MTLGGVGLKPAERHLYHLGQVHSCGHVLMVVNTGVEEGHGQ